MEERKKCYNCEKIRLCTELDTKIWVCRECGKEVNNDGSSKN